MVGYWLPLPTITFSDMLGVWNRLWWEDWHRSNNHFLQIRTVPLSLLLNICLLTTGYSELPTTASSRQPSFCGEEKHHWILWDRSIFFFQLLLLVWIASGQNSGFTEFLLSHQWSDGMQTPALCLGPSIQWVSTFPRMTTPPPATTPQPRLLGSYEKKSLDL